MNELHGWDHQILFPPSLAWSIFSASPDLISEDRQAGRKRCKQQNTVQEKTGLSSPIPHVLVTEIGLTSGFVPSSYLDPETSATERRPARTSLCTPLSHSQCPNNNHKTFVILAIMIGKVYKTIYCELHCTNINIQPQTGTVNNSKVGARLSENRPTKKVEETWLSSSPSAEFWGAYRYSTQQGLAEAW